MTSKSTLVSVSPSGEELIGLCLVETTMGFDLHNEGKQYWETTIRGLPELLNDHKCYFDDSRFHQKMAHVDAHHFKERSENLDFHDLIVVKLLVQNYDYDIQLDYPEEHEPAVINIYEIMGLGE